VKSGDFLENLAGNFSILAGNLAKSAAKRPCTIEPPFVQANLVGRMGMALWMNCRKLQGHGGQRLPAVIQLLVVGRSGH
jgi:hypothetical protein